MLASWFYANVPGTEGDAVTRHRRGCRHGWPPTACLLCQANRDGAAAFLIVALWVGVYWLARNGPPTFLHNILLNWIHG